MIVTVNVLGLLLASRLVLGEHVTDQLVAEGETAELGCSSNDSTHVFLYWQLPNDGVVSPKNRFDTRKYKYEAIEGTIWIKNAQISDGGIFKCVSEGLREQDILISTINLRVVPDFKEYVYLLISNGLKVPTVLLGIVAIFATIMFIAKWRHLKKIRKKCSPGGSEDQLLP